MPYRSRLIPSPLKPKSRLGTSALMPSLAPLRYPIPYPTSQADTMQPKNSSEKNTICIALATGGRPVGFRQAQEVPTPWSLLSSRNRLTDALLLHEQLRSARYSTHKPIALLSVNLPQFSLALPTNCFRFPFIWCVITSAPRSTYSIALWQQSETLLSSRWRCRRQPGSQGTSNGDRNYVPC